MVGDRCRYCTIALLHGALRYAKREARGESPNRPPAPRPVPSSRPRLHHSLSAGKLAWLFHDVRARPSTAEAYLQAMGHTKCLTCCTVIHSTKYRLILLPSDPSAPSFDSHQHIGRRR